MAPLPVIVMPIAPLGPHLYIPIRPARGSTRPRDELQSAVKRLENIKNLTTGTSFGPPLTIPSQSMTSTQRRPAISGGRAQTRSKSNSSLEAENNHLKKEMAKIKRVLLDTHKTLVETKKGVSILQKQLSDTRKDLKKSKDDNEELAQQLERKSNRSKSVGG